MKNLIGYIFGFALCAFFIHELSGHFKNCTCQDYIYHADKRLAVALFCCCAITSILGIITETFKLISKIILQNSENK